MAWIVEGEGKMIYQKDDVVVFEKEPEHLANKYKVKEFTNITEIMNIHLRDQNPLSNPRAKKAIIKQANKLRDFAPELYLEYKANYNHVFNCIYNQTS